MCHTQHTANTVTTGRWVYGNRVEEEVGSAKLAETSGRGVAESRSGEKNQWETESGEGVDRGSAWSTRE